MKSLFKEILLKFITKQVLLFFIINIAFVILASLFADSLLFFILFAFFSYALHISLYQYLINAKIKIKSIIPLMFRFFFLWLGIAILSGTPLLLVEYLELGTILNNVMIFLNTYFLTRLSVLFPMLVAKDKLNLKHLWNFTKEKFYFWFIISTPFAIFMFESNTPEIELNKTITTIIYSFVFTIIPVFYSTYYKKKKALQ